MDLHIVKYFTTWSIPFIISTSKQNKTQNYRGKCGKTIKCINFLSSDLNSALPIQRKAGSCIQQ